MPATPYYDHAGIQIYHGDARDVLPQVPDIADAVLTDPPYGVGMHAFIDDFSKVKTIVQRCGGGLAAIFMSPRRVVQLAQQLEPSWTFERVLWMHKVADISMPWHGWLMNSEAICLFSRSFAEWPDDVTYHRDVYDVAPWGTHGHPTSKPLWVVQDVLEKICRRAVLDPFMGSGTTLLAAKRLSRRAIGIDIEERYCELAANRLAQDILPLNTDAPLTPQQSELFTGQIP
jgi:site-specific DNA-methyltransferase (adenine-specific)